MTVTDRAPRLPEQLLEAAEAEITEVGMADASLRSIARRVGVSHQAPGHHFGDRNGLFTALAAKGFGILEKRMLAARRRISDGASPGERVTALGVEYMRFAQARPALFTVMFRPELQGSKDPDLVAARRGAFAVLMGEVADAHAAGWGAGHSEETLALTCMSTAHGAVMLWRDGVLDAYFQRSWSLKSVADQVATVVADGFAQDR